MARDAARLDPVATIDRVLLAIAGAALVLMMLQICIDVFGNAFFGTPLPLTNAIVTQYWMIAVAYLPLAATEYRRAHVGVDLVVKQLPAGLRRALDTVVQLLCLGIYGALSAQAWQLATERFARNAFLMEQSTRVSTWPSYFIIPVGFGLVAALLALRLAFRLLGRPDPAPHRAEGAAEAVHD